MDCQVPHLGLATTRQLLQELEARGELGSSWCQYPATAQYLKVSARVLLREMPDDLLDYRTVDA